MASPALSAFTVAIGFEADEQSARRTGQQFDSIKKKALSLGSVLAGVFGARHLTFGVANEVDQIAKASARLGLTATELSAWGRIVQHAGGSAEELYGWFDNLQGIVANIRFNDGLLNDFAQAGISPSMLLAGKNPADTAMMFSKALQANAGDPMAIRRIRDAMQASGPISDALQAGPSGLREQLADESRRLSISQELIDSSAEFNKQMLSLETSLTRLSYAISEWILPPINKVLEGFNSIADSARMVDKPTEGATQILPGVFISKNKAPEAAGDGGAPVQIKGIFNLNGRALGEVITEAIEGGNSQQQPSGGGFSTQGFSGQ